MDFKLGEKVVYPNHGVGVIEQISYGYLNGRSERYYMLRIVSSGLKVMVPQSNAENVGLRAVIRSTQAGEVLSYLEKGRSASHHDWKHRFKENSDRMRTGSLMEVAAVLKGLVALSRTKPLSFREKKMLERAKYPSGKRTGDRAKHLRAGCRGQYRPRARKSKTANAGNDSTTRIKFSLLSSLYTGHNLQRLCPVVFLGPEKLWAWAYCGELRCQNFQPSGCFSGAIAHFVNHRQYNIHYRRGATSRRRVETGF